MWFLVFASLCSQFVGLSGDASSPSVVVHSITTHENLRELMKDYTNLFLFFCAEEAATPDTPSCPGGEYLLKSVADVVLEYRGNPVRGFTFGMSRAAGDSELAEFYGVDEIPAMLYVRKNAEGEEHCLRYRGDLNDKDTDETFVTMWMRENARSYLKTLTDETFEHLTQAASGATTGDWLVLFGRRDDWNDDGRLRTALDTVAAEYKHQLSVAFVDRDVNVDLVKRLKVSGDRVAKTLLYFRLERMYHYEGHPMTFDALKTFVTGGFRHVKSEKVPPEDTPWDAFLERVVARIREIGYPNIVGPLILTLALAAATSILVVLACCASKGQRKDQDTKFKKG